jgi:hypothetical protein
VSTTQIAVASCGTGTLYNTYTTAKSILPASAVYMISANYLYVGKAYRINALCGLTNKTGTSATVQFSVKTGPTSNIIALISDALVMSTTAHTIYPCKVVVDLWCGAIGSGTSANWGAIGQITALGLAIGGTPADPTVTMSSFVCPSASVSLPGSGAAGFNSTVATVIDFWVGFSVSDGANGIQVWNYYVEDLNGP